MRSKRMVRPSLVTELAFSVAAVAVFAFPAVGATTSLANFNEFPSAVVAQLTAEQQASCNAARELSGDGREVSAIEACERLLKDMTIPDDLYRWA